MKHTAIVTVTLQFIFEDEGDFPLVDQAHDLTVARFNWTEMLDCDVKEIVPYDAEKEGGSDASR